MTESQLATFEAALRRERPDTKISIDTPASPDGIWWMDVSEHGAATSVSWQRGFGFGIFTEEESYGDKPDEKYADAELATRRVVQLMDRPKSADPRMWLRDVRALLGVQQIALAEELQVNQAAISRLEARDDMKLSTLLAYFEALGGKVEMRVRFKDFEAGIAKPAAKVAEDV